MDEAIVLLEPAPGATNDRPTTAADRVLELVDVTQRFGPAVLIIQGDAEAIGAISALPGVRGVYEGLVPADIPSPSDEAGVLGVAAWNERQRSRAAAMPRIGEGRAWDDPSFRPEGHPDPEER